MRPGDPEPLNDGEMMGQPPMFLPGVAEKRVRAALDAAGGNEIDSGKLDSPESSAALAVNAFGWFLERPEDLPLFPPLREIDEIVRRVDIERQMRFPWRGGRHPWLDASVETASHLIGIESKRFEPFRDVKSVNLSKAYDRDVWGNGMAPFTVMRDALGSRAITFSHLDAAQLVKHAFGLVTEGRRLRKAPILLYLFAEPHRRGNVEISQETLKLHRDEIAQFSTSVANAEVRFVACSYLEWLAEWDGAVRQHADALIARFQL